MEISIPDGSPDHVSVRDPRSVEQEVIPCVINGIDLSSLVPSYNVTKKGIEGRSKIYTVHLRRKYLDLKLFLTPFYFACFTYFLMNGIDPTGSFEKLYYDTNVYKRSKGVLHKNTNQWMAHFDRLDVKQVKVKRRGRTSKYLFVTARFNDPNSVMNYDISMICCSLNVTLYIGKKLRELIGDYENFNYATFFESFLRKISYHKAVYIVNKKIGTLHCLLALQKDIENRMMKGSG